MSKDKVTISKQISSCYEYVELAERAALDGSFQESNRLWKLASNLAITLLQKHEHGLFLDEEYDFLKQIAKHFRDVDDESQYY